MIHFFFYFFFHEAHYFHSFRFFYIQTSSSRKLFMENLVVPSSGWLELKQINSLVTEEVFHSALGEEYMHIILCVRFKFFENGMQSLFASLEISKYFKLNFANAEIDFWIFLFYLSVSLFVSLWIRSHLVLKLLSLFVYLRPRRFQVLSYQHGGWASPVC